MFDLSQGFFKTLADSFDDPPLQSPSPTATETFELPLTEEKQETTGGATLDAASIGSLRSMFLLLDQWDREPERRKAEKSSGKCQISIDTKIH